jgi:heterodisulfide reductase subunit C
LAIRAVYGYEEGGKRNVAEVCLKCGVCCNVAHSCHVMHDNKFNPRYTFVYDCLASEKGASNPNIWLCVSCHKCEETCPYEVSPVHFIEALKGDALQLGLVHPTIRAELTQVITTGFSFPLTGATERQRQALNLKPLSPQPIIDLTKIAESTGLTERLRETKQ